MPKYVIERKVPGVGQSTQEELKAMAQQSNQVLNQLNGEAAWLESYVTDDKIYCVYVARNEDVVRRHAQLAGFPVDSIARVDTILDPSSGELEPSQRTAQDKERAQSLQ